MLTIEKDVPLAPYTSFDIGGPAAYFIAVGSRQELREALLFTQREALPYCVLGGGTNLLISDEGFAGVVIKTAFDAVEMTRQGVVVEAAADLTNLVRMVSARGLTGMEGLAGIPGTLGGAIRGNAGAYGYSIGDVVRTVWALDAETLDELSFDREECRFGYRSSHFKRHRNLIVTAAELTLPPGEPEASLRKAQETIDKRIARHLHYAKSVGSFFMNPLVPDADLIRAFESDQQTRCRDGRIPAGWIIDQLGLRNLKVGGAMVSEKHANYLINTGGAKAAEVVELAQRIKEQVRASMGVELMEEVTCLGFAFVQPQDEHR